jgi:hypothetical protein
VSAPNAPTLSVANNGDGVSVTATVAGDVNVTNQLLFKSANAALWSYGNTCSGSGTITQSGLTASLLYQFIAVSSEAGAWSLPSTPCQVIVRATVTAVVEQIAQAILASLETLVGSGATSVIRPQRYGTEPTLSDGMLVLIQDHEEPAEDITSEAGGERRWYQHFGVLCCVRPSDTSTAAVDTAINNLRGYVEKQLRADPSFGGLAQDSRIMSVDYFPNGKTVDGVRVNLRVKYLVKENDPFSQT